MADTENISNQSEESINNHSEIESKMNFLKLSSDEVQKNDETIILENGILSENNIDGKSEGEITGNEFSPIPGVISSANKKYDESYNMNHKRRGYCLVFNQKDFNPDMDLGTRNGTNADRDNVSSLFKCLGFDVVVKNNSSVKEIQTILDEYTYDVDHMDSDCFVVIFMSHGKDGLLYGRDDDFKYEILFSNFTADNCPSLAGKPKMFFIQACQGVEVDSGVKLGNKKPEPVDETDGGDYSIYKIPTHSDFLVCWSTVPGHFSWRNPKKGTWFIQSIVKAFRQYANTLDVLSMMSHVNRFMMIDFESYCPSSSEIGGKKQTASIVSTLMRFIYLKPKQ